MKVGLGSWKVLVIIVMGVVRVVLGVLLVCMFGEVSSR